MSHEIDPAAEQNQDATDIATASALALRTAAMQELDTVEAGLSDLATKYKGVVFDVTTTKRQSRLSKSSRRSMSECHCSWSSACWRPSYSTATRWSR